MRLAGQRHRGQCLQIVREYAFGHGDIDVTAFATALRIEERGENTHRRHHRAAENVGNLDIGDHRIALLAADLVGKTGVTAIVDVVAGTIAVWSGLAITGNGAIDDARIDFATRGITHAQTIDHPGTEPFHHGIGVAHQPQEYFHPFGFFQIEPKRPLVAVYRSEHRC